MHEENKIPEIVELNFENSKKLSKNKNKTSKKSLFILFFIFYFLSIFTIIYINIKELVFEKKIIKNISELKENKKLINIIEKKQNFLFQISKYDYISRNLKNKNKSNIINILHSMDVKGKVKTRIGNYGDGGYILLDDFNNIKIAYSFGISREISFDKGLADKNIDIFMYDHTISKLPYENPKFPLEKNRFSSREYKKYTYENSQ